MTARFPFVLVHGAWHGAWTYEQVIPELAALGHAAVARDLPAHGIHARFPDSFSKRPLDPVSFATEPSKVAATTLDDYVASIEQSIDALSGLGHSKVVLVGHSMGGVPITAVQNAKSAFYEDVSDDAFAAIAHLLTPDVPVAPFATPIATTSARWGSVERHYIKCLQARAIRPALQQRFIDEANTFVPEKATHVHTLESSHSPFMSQPKVLAALLAKIASQ